MLDKQYQEEELQRIEDEWIDEEDNYELFEELRLLNNQLKSVKRKRRLAMVSFDQEVRQVQVKLDGMLSDKFYDVASLAELLGETKRDIVRKLSSSILGEAVQIQGKWYIKKSSVQNEVSSQINFDMLFGGLL